MAQPPNNIIYVVVLIVFIVVGIFQFEDYQRDKTHLVQINELIRKSLLSAKSNAQDFQNDIGKTQLAKIEQLNAGDYQIENIKHDRLAVICYIPPGENEIYHFLPLLYGSWKYITNKESELVPKEKLPDTLRIDLLAFCHPKACSAIRDACLNYSNFDESHTEMPSVCWAIEQPFESPVPYGPINSYIMFNRTDISAILKPYRYTLRTDYDVFLTPAALLWRPSKQIIVGKGGYCDPFNMKRLKEIAQKLGLKHRGVHCVGSTWYGETSAFIKASKKAYELTAYLYLNEFHPSLPGLETINFTVNPAGEWIRWWQPVSSLYGSELALNDAFQDFSPAYKGPLDGSSCDENVLVSQVPHIHCWHNDCEFRKFDFIDRIRAAIYSTGTLEGKIIHLIIENSYEKDVRYMTLKDYSVYIAWNSVGKYLKKWFVS